jgi:hypothetical protein
MHSGKRVCLSCVALNDRLAFHYHQFELAARSLVA